MENYNMHSTLYNKNGGVNFARDECGILLKKRYGSIVYCPNHNEKEPGALYPRCIQLRHNGQMNGTLLATFECYTHSTPVFPIFRSFDEGSSWHPLSCVEDKIDGFGCRFQPHLFELNSTCGDLPAGTILCAGNIIPESLESTSLRIYKSLDGGVTWKFMSEIVGGGHVLVEADTCDEKRPVWEPFLTTTPKNHLICFYSDERYEKREGYNQILAHKVSEDGGYTWGEAKIDVAFSDGILRPGMPIVKKLPNGKFIMVYEIVNQDKIPIYFRISDSIEDWGDVSFKGNLVTAADGSYLTGTPYVTWIPQGGENGTILVTGRGFSRILANSNMGEGFWKPMESLIAIDNTMGDVGYSQCLLPLGNGSRLLSLCPNSRSEKLALIECAVADVYVRSEY